MTPPFINLTNCEREPIHILGHIQSHGFLIAFQPDTHTVVHASDNLAAFTGVPADALLGQPVQPLLTAINQPVDLLTNFLTGDETAHRFTLNGTAWNLIAHSYNGLVLLECEPAGAAQNELANNRLVTEALAEVQSNQTITTLLQRTARRVKDIIGFDRVMVYRFSHDWHGQVIAEAGAGLSALTLSSELNEYLLWFKPGRVEKATWAGNPISSLPLPPTEAISLAPAPVLPPGQHRFAIRPNPGLKPR